MASKLSVSSRDGEEEYSRRFRLIDIIFLPFNTVFRIFTLVAVLLKCIFGPMQAVYPFAYCDDYTTKYPFFIYIKYLYLYYTRFIYGVDLFLHIMHRQIADEAMKREFLPKSGIKILLDFFSLIPFYQMIASESCPTVTIFPNILALSEFIVVYRVLEFFDLKGSHSFLVIITGYIVILCVVMNCFAITLLVLSLHGLCSVCGNGVYDWRSYLIVDYPDVNYGFNTYFFAIVYCITYTVHELIIEVKPSAVNGYVILIFMALSSYVFIVSVFAPKLFAEHMLRIRRLTEYHTRIERIILDTKRRNTSPFVVNTIENFYNVLWQKRHGLTHLPEVISNLPRHMRTDIRQDLVWAVFFHSPTLRNTSPSFKRWICEHIRLTYKLPEENFFSGPHCLTNLYYIKSGTVQFISSDDSKSALLSVSGGTIFGDVSFYNPPTSRNITVKCFTYCEIFVLSRRTLLKALHLFPEDRHQIIYSAKLRIRHARTLYQCKLEVPNLERSEQEGLMWIKSRWWQIFTYIDNWKKVSKKEGQKCEIPQEKSKYHCAKYIGQLVLCSDYQLQKKSTFASTKFPWILMPNSQFLRIWSKFIKLTTLFVLFIYPPYSFVASPPLWFEFMNYYINFVFAMDVFVHLITTSEKLLAQSSSFTSVMLYRIKTPLFLLNLFSALWVEDILQVMDLKEYYNLGQMSHLCKIYVFFVDENHTWKWNIHPKIKMYQKLILCYVAYQFIWAHIIYAIRPHFNLTFTDFMWTENENKWGIILTWIRLYAVEFIALRTKSDVALLLLHRLVTYILVLYLKSKYMSIIYLNRLESSDYQYFVSNLKKHYIFHKIHPDLLKRLNRYLTCHWKYFRGMDILKPNILKAEPYDIYYKCHGALAEKIISSSRVFSGADRSLIKELAYATKFVILPRASTLTLFGVPSKNVTWIANGEVKYEYHNDKGELVERFEGSGQMLAMGSVFFNKASLRTISTATDCEILYISVKEFLKIYQRYPLEWGYVQQCTEEFSKKFDILFYDYIKKHKEYQKKLRKRIFHARQSVANIKKKTETEVPPTPEEKQMTYVADFTSFSFLDNPESKFIKYWMLLRMISTLLMFTISILGGGSGAHIFHYIIDVQFFCYGIAIIDIALKLFFPFYDDNGIVITNTCRCMVHYLSRTFILDVVGILPLNGIVRSVLSEDYAGNMEFLLDNIPQFAHLYLVIGYFNYIADAPAMKSIYIIIFKWQLILTIAFLASGAYFMTRCIAFKWDAYERLVSMTKMDTCWLPTSFNLTTHPDVSDLHVVFAMALNLAQSGLLSTNLGMYNIQVTDYGTIAIYIIIGCFYWYVFIYNQTLLMLQSRSNSIFQHGVSQLTDFMKAERVEEEVLNKVIEHYNYLWVRTKGLNIQDLMTDRIGMIFKEDLNFYFYKKTFAALDTMINGGEAMQRRLAKTMLQAHFLPGEDIMREMDLVPKIYIVHRGSVLITQNKKKMAILYKGGIFGQFDSEILRPVHVTAQAIEHTDVLVMTVKEFHEVLTEMERKTMLKNPETANDYMVLKKVLIENPYNTIRYLLRGTKTIKLPRMREPVEADKSKWYTYYLMFVWLWITTTSVVISLLCVVVPHETQIKLQIALSILDFFHLVNIISEFYTMELVVEGHKCVYKYIGWRNLAELEFYLDAISFFVPVIAEFAGYWNYGIFRVIRLHHYFNFYRHFCKNFKYRSWKIILKYVIGLLVVHAITCGWMYIACRNISDNPFLDIRSSLPDSINKTLNFLEWSLPQDRQSGCPRLTRTTGPTNNKILWFVKGKTWHVDYLISLSFVVIIYMKINLDLVLALSLGQMYYKILISIILYMGEMWISSIAISAIYTKYRELYQYAYDVSNLLQYLKQNDLSNKLLAAVRWYTKMLWRRQKGNWIPEMALQAPMCLREDIFSALYIHHLMTPTLFQNHLPPYFMRQLVVRFKRMVIFPGKYIIKEGDIFPSIYFIHEGEVEKWYTDVNGNSKIASVLTMNGYFGLIPGLFPNTPFLFTYYSRTVCDLLLLRHEEWQDLLNGYPEIKNNLYKAAKEVLHKELLKKQQ